MAGMSEKVVGYLLLVVGLLVILFSSVSVYNVFTKKTVPVSFITESTKPLSFDLDLPTGTGGSTKVPLQLGENPLGAFSGQFDAVTHLILMSFIASAGFKVASLGVNLVRPIVVKAKAQA